MSKLYFENLEIYQIANKISLRIWNLIIRWDYFNRDTLGKQIVRSADSVALNISEGCGRYYYKDKKLFFYYSRGSLYETYAALKKGRERNLIGEDDYNQISIDITELAVKLNNFIRVIGKN